MKNSAKRLLSLLIVLAMTLSMLPGTAWATDGEIPVEEDAAISATDSDASICESVSSTPETDGEILEAAYALGIGEVLPYVATLTGKIVTVNTPYSSQYQNITVTIAVEGYEDMPVQCYRLQGDGADLLAVGDTITVTGNIENYNGTVEFMAGCTLDSYVKGENEEITAPEDPGEILEAAYALGIDEALPYVATLTGKIVTVNTPYSSQYQNITVTIAVEGYEDMPVQCYRLNGDGADLLAVGDTITVTGNIENYNGTVEFMAGCTLDSYVKGESGDTVDPDSPQGIVDAAYALGSGEVLPGKKTLTGQVSEIIIPYDMQYMYITVTLIVAGREDKPVECSRLKGNGVDMLAVGDTITVTGTLSNYYGIAQFADGCTLDSFVKGNGEVITVLEDPTELVTAAYNLAKGEALPYAATLSGKVTEIIHSYDTRYEKITVDIIVASCKDKPIRCFCLWGTGIGELEVGSTVTVRGYLKNGAMTDEETGLTSNMVGFDSGCYLRSYDDPVTAVDPSLLTYAIENNQVTITGCDTSAGQEVVLPDTIEGYPVTAIGDYAFSSQSNLVFMTIPESVTSIGIGAFYNCKKLIWVNIPEKVTTIQPSTFEFCLKLVDVNLPSGIRSIGDGAFRNCQSLADLTLPACLTSIGERAFYECTSLYTLIIPRNVTFIGPGAFTHCMAVPGTLTIPAATTSIGAGAFSQCNALTGFLVEEANPAYCNDEFGVLYTKDMTTLVQVPHSITGAYVIPEGVTRIEAQAFAHITSLTSVTIPASLEEIGEFAFYGVENLAPLVFSDPNINFDSNAFNVSSACSEYDNCFYIGIEGNPFYRLYKFDPGSVSPSTCQVHPDTKVIDPGVFFEWEWYINVTLPEGVTTIGEKAFYGRNIYINIPSTVTEVGDYAFYNCNMMPGTSLDGLTTIGEGVFQATLWSHSLNDYQCADVTIPEGIVHIGDHAFAGASGIANLKLPDTVTHIGDYAFAGATGIGNLEIPKSVTFIGEAAFKGCNGIREVTVAPGCSGIGNSAFMECTNLTTVTISEGVTGIGDCAFFNCTNLTTVSVPTTLTDIGNSAFYGCDNLQYNTYKYGQYLGNEQFPALILMKGNSGVTELSPYTLCIHTEAFWSLDRSGPVKIIIPDSVIAINYAAFQGCAALKTIIFEGNAPVISVDAFAANKESDDEVVATAYYPQGNPTWTEDVLQDYGGIITWEAVSPSLKYLEYTVNDGKVTITACDTAAQGVLAIPATLEGYPVTAIRGSAFRNCQGLTEITIPDSVTSIGYAAFEGCSSLTAITIPDSVTSLAGSVFSECDSLTTVTIGDGVTVIESYAFYNCPKLSNVTMSSKVTSIGYAAFNGCSSLTAITIPDSVTSIGYAAFNGCSSLTAITIPDSVTSLAGSVFSECDSLTTVTIGDGVTAIESCAFLNCPKLSNVTMSNKVTSIGESAFSHCTSLTEVIIPDSVTVIGEDAFYACESFSSLTLSNNVTTIGNAAFMFCGLVGTVTIPASVTDLAANAFDGNALTAFSVAKDNPCYSNDAYGALLNKDQSTLLRYPEAGVAPYTIPDSVIIIGDRAFNGCNLGSLIIPDSVESIGVEATSIASIQTITVGRGVTSIADWAFAYTNGLQTVYFLGDAPVFGADVFLDACITAYYDYNASGWSGDVRQSYGGTVSWLTMPDTYGVLEYMIQDGNAIIIGHTESLQGELIIPSQINGYPVTEIADNAFADCTGLTALTIPGSVVSIGENAFDNCVNLSEVTLQEGVERIDACAFANCTGLTQILLPNSLTSIGDYAFSGCSALPNVFIPVGVTSVGASVFSACSSMAAICVDPDNAAFYSDGDGVLFTKDGTVLVAAPCAISGSYIVPDGVDTIVYGAFYDARQLTEVIIPATVTCVGTLAFAECVSLQNVIFCGDAPVLNDYAFAIFSEPVHAYITFHYPEGNATWTEEVMSSCGEHIVWVPDGETDTDCTEHSYESEVTAPTCSTGGYTTYICSKCGHSYQDQITAAAGHSYQNGICMICGAADPDYVLPAVIPTLTLKSPTLEFKDMITVNAMFTAENIEDVVEMGMITYKENVDVWNVETAAHVIPGTTYDVNTGRYIAHSQGIHAKYLGDTVYLAVYAKLSDGTYAYSKLAPYSPVQYANSQLKNSSDVKLKQLVAAMLNYGAEAQLFFDHNVENLANASLTDEQKALPESYRADMVGAVPAASADKQGAFANNQGFSKRYPAISFEGAFCINYFFKPSYTPVDGITLYYWKEADFAAAEVLTVENASGSLKLELEDSGEYRGDIAGISARDLSEAVYVAAVYSDGTTTWTSGVLGYSIGAYCSGQSSKGTAVAALAEATAVYGYHAKQYFV